MAEERQARITDDVQAQLVDCTPTSEPATDAPARPQDQTPTEQARDATIEQTGADPPPRGGTP